MSKKKGAAPANLGPVKIGGVTFEKKAVTLPTLKLEVDQPAYVKIISAIRDGRPGKPGKDGEAMKPARIVDVLDLSDDPPTPAQLVLGKVLESTLVEQYPGDGFIGKSFEVIQRATVEGQRYRQYTVSELTAKVSK